MAGNDAPVYIFKTRNEADAAERQPLSSGFDPKQLSLIARGYHSEQHPVGFYTVANRIKTWGGAGALWGGFWGLLFAPAVFFLPGLGLIAMAGPFVWLPVGILEGAVRRLADRRGDPLTQWKVSPNRQRSTGHLNV